MTLTHRVAEVMYAEQRRIVRAFEDYDGQARFRSQEWARTDLGAGTACILEGGRVFERAGVNVSMVGGPKVPSAVGEGHPGATGKPFTATGISMVLHPVNPYAPAFHANFRFFAAAEESWWFGGGCDLTPTYGFDEDAVHFHRQLKTWCDRHETGTYAAWKQACDDYFLISHRGEMRGIGGVFFDDLSEPGPGGFERCLSLVTDGLRTALPAYLPILDRRCDLPYGRRQRDWQLARRGRYVEFNLVYDRGTLFGLQTRGNPEAILMSLPPLARWGFDIRPEPDSPEGDTARFLRPHDWLDLASSGDGAGRRTVSVGSSGRPR